MHFTFLRLMECPYCGSDFRAEVVIEKKDDELVNGCVQCECSEYPVLEGILILKERAVNGKIIELIKENKTEEAATLYLSVDSFERSILLERSNLSPLPVPSSVSHALGRMASRYAKGKAEPASKALYKRFSDENLTLFNLLGNNFVFPTYDTYTKQRFSVESLWSLYPFLPLIKKEHGRILDLCCGTGQTSFILSESVQPQELCCADSEFRNLYLAKKYFAQKAEFVCLDANLHLPFKNGTFSSILVADAFFLIRSHVSLAREMERILFQDGLILLLHLHNVLDHSAGVQGGYGLTPKAWGNLFRTGNLGIKLITEKKVIDDYLFENKLDLTTEYGEETLNSSHAIVLFATLDKSLLTTYDNVDRVFLSAKSNLIINPIYEVTETESQVLLERPLFKYARHESYLISENYLPRRLKMEKESFSGGKLHISNVGNVEDLMRRFIIINVPKKFK